MIAVIDYGVGNIRNVAAALREVGLPVTVTADAADVRDARGVVLPGVGAFPDAAAHLRASGLIPVLNDHVSSGKPLLGICLGMQLLFESSTEGTGGQGLGWLPGRVVRLNAPTVPHMGWNRLEVRRPDSLTAGLGAADHAYFLHSYYVEECSPDLLLVTAEYEVSVPAIVRSGHVVGMQFHPEKSGAVGLSLLNGFAELVR